MNENRSNFCISPWIQLRAVANGDAYACCVAKQFPENKLGNVNVVGLHDLMNSSTANAIRKNFLENKPLPPMCIKCKQTEDAGNKSFRNYINSHYEDRFDELVTDNTNHDGSLKNVKLLRWDFRFSNKCNMACVTCHPKESTLWHKDYVKIHGFNTAPFPVLQQLNKKSTFFTELSDQLDHVEEIRFAGGEPMIMDDHWDILKKLHDKKKFDVRLEYSTNMSTLSYKKQHVFDYWKYFNNVLAVLSIDGINEHFDYIRYGGRWDITKNNLLSLSQADIANISISTTVSILNILHLPEMHREILNMGILQSHTHSNKRRVFRFGFCFNPEIYNIKALPLELKQLAEERIKTYLQENQNNPFITPQDWLAIINFMYSEDLSHQFNNFITMIKKLEAIRKNSFIEIQPEFTRYFQ